MDAVDEELIRACNAGEREAFSQLVERHQDAVFNLAYRMTGNRSDAADSAQEAFIRAYRKLSTFRSGGSFRNWVLGICANVTKNRFRSDSRRRLLEEEHGHADAVGTVQAPRMISRRTEAMEQALMELPEDMRALLVLKYMEGLSGEEIAQALRIGVGAVKMRLLRGREALLQRVTELETRMRP